jgi:hypothetical protein
MVGPKGTEMGPRVSRTILSAREWSDATKVICVDEVRRMGMRWRGRALPRRRRSLSNRAAVRTIAMAELRVVPVPQHLTPLYF